MMSERLSPVDMAFLCLENGAAPMHLGAVGVFQTPHALRPGRVVAMLRDRAQQVPRLRQRVRAAWLPPGGAVWAEDPAFDVDNHIRMHRLRSAGLDDVAALSADLMAEPLDLSRPLWQLHVITGLAGRGFAIMAKLHHALCDAYGAMGLGRGLLDGPTPQEIFAPTLRRTSLGGGLSRPDRLVGAAIKTATDAASQSLEALGIASSMVGKLRLPPASPLLAAPSGARRVIMAKLG
jgi:WS/DGAT/MGAT family acyltransferase